MAQDPRTKENRLAHQQGLDALNKWHNYDPWLDAKKLVAAGKKPEGKSMWDPRSVVPYLWDSAYHLGKGAVGDLARLAVAMPAGATGQTPNQMIGDWPSFVGSTADFVQSMKPFQYDYAKKGNVFNTDSYYSPHKRTFNRTLDDPEGGGAYKYALNYAPGFRSVVPRGTFYNRFKTNPGYSNVRNALRPLDYISYERQRPGLYGHFTNSPVSARVERRGDVSAKRDASDAGIIGTTFPQGTIPKTVHGWYQQHPGGGYGPRIVYPGKEKKANTKRHEETHVVDIHMRDKAGDARRPASIQKISDIPKNFMHELDANVGGHKSVSKGLDQTAANIGGYVQTGNVFKDVALASALSTPWLATKAAFPLGSRTPRPEVPEDAKRWKDAIRSLTRPEGARDDVEEYVYD